MADVLTKEQRRKNMQAIKSQSKLENKFSRALWKKGIRFRKNIKDLYGKPDIAIKKYRIVIFIDSCFWHCCEVHGNIPKSNSDFWIKKLDRNKERDIEVNNYYLAQNWYIKRIWEHEIKQDIDKVIAETIIFIEKAKSTAGDS